MKCNFYEKTGTVKSKFIADMLINRLLTAKFPVIIE